jgi:hypothetical protein
MLRGCMSEKLSLVDVDEGHSILRSSTVLVAHPNRIMSIPFYKNVGVCNSPAKLTETLRGIAFMINEDERETALNGA